MSVVVKYSDAKSSSGSSLVFHTLLNVKLKYYVDRPKKLLLCPN